MGAYKEGEKVKGGPWDGFEVISAYSRSQAIDDGMLIDISDLAREAGFKFPVAITPGVYGVLVPWDGIREDIGKPSPGQPLYGLGQSFKGRAWDLLSILLLEIRKGQTGERVDFAPLFIMPGKGDHPRVVEMYAICGPGDDVKPVVTVMLKGED